MNVVRRVYSDDLCWNIEFTEFSVTKDRSDHAVLPRLTRELTHIIENSVL